MELAHIGDLTCDLWHFLFSLFGMHWGAFYVKGVVPSWHRSFVGRTRKKVRDAATVSFLYGLVRTK